MRLVVDGTVALEVCLAGGNLGPLGGHELHAPALLASEVASVLREMAWRGELNMAQARGVADRLVTLGLRYARAGSLVTDALDVAERLGWAKTYDAEYVALARRLRCPLVTSDARLQRGAGAVVTIVGPTQI